MKTTLGLLLPSPAGRISFVLELLINILAVLVNLVSGVRQLFTAVVGIGCFIILMNPFLLVFLSNPAVLTIALVLVVFPIVGKISISFLRYLNYMVTEYLYDKGDELITGKKPSYRSFGEYGNKYRRMEEEKERRAQEERQKAQQRMWEERFRQWNEQSRGQGYGGYGGWYQQGGGGQYQQQYTNPTDDFNKQYRESCQVLGVSTSADKYEIKLAYRKMAKTYHPDVNKSPDANTMFQKINNAYEFLSDENIERYRKLNAS